MKYLIRENKTQILSCTIVNSADNQILVKSVPFREAVDPSCGILFYYFHENFYYPISMEFRLIDNNILFLIEELNISKFTDLSDILKSSFKREEGKIVTFFPIIYKVKIKPKYATLLKNFKIDTDL